MNTIKLGDWVVVINKNDKQYGKIARVTDIKSYGSISINIDGILYEAEKDEVQRIQDYFEPGDEIAIYEKDVNMYYEATVQKIGGKSLLFTEETRGIWGLELDVWRGRIHNLTKEGKMKDEKREIPTHLTIKDLFEKEACEQGVRRFVEKFGKQENLKSDNLKEWFEIIHPLYKDWLKDNLPDHYAVIFDSWQPKKNDYVFRVKSHNDIGRIYSIYEKCVKIKFHDGVQGDYDINEIKPISERDFQVGDCYRPITKNGKIDYSTYTITRIRDNKVEINGAEWIHIGDMRKEFYLVISPAIPEVKQ